jgi:hypothetical protein
MWKRTLSQIPTHFGRLVFIANLRDAGGGYIFRPLIESVGCEVTDRTLANSHYTVFAEWIACSLSTQKADLDDYVRAHGSEELARFREFIPGGAHEVERQLYLTDLETLLAMLRYEPGAASSIRIA